MAVLRPRLAIPIDRLIGIIDVSAAALQAVEEGDSAIGWTGGLFQLGELELRLLDPDRLVALLRRFRDGR
jgi:hypothetical protein